MLSAVCEFYSLFWYDKAIAHLQEVTNFATSSPQKTSEATMAGGTERTEIIFKWILKEQYMRLQFGLY
jgi:hypothetical protein